MVKNKSILLVAYYFPPLGMGGTGRPYALFRYLPEHGFNVYILTVKNILYPEYDYSLLQDEDSNRIIRTGSFDPARILYLLGLRKQKGTAFPRLAKSLPLYFPDLKRGWNMFAWRRVRNIIRENDISALITTAPPPSIHLLGLKTKKSFEIPWIADFRDYWFPLPIEQVYSPGLMQSYAFNLKNDIVSRADEVVSVNNDIRRYYGRGEVIMNGAEPSSAEVWRKTVKEKDDRLIIGAMGTFNYLFPIEPLFKAVRILLDKGMISPGNMAIIHVGHYDNEMRKYIDRYRLHDIVELKGYLNRADAVASLADADLLYLAVNKYDRYNILPGRIFDYLVSGRAVVGMVPRDSDAEKLLKEYPYGSVVTDYDAEKLSDVIYQSCRDKEQVSGRTEDIIIDTDKYTMKGLAAKYAAVLNRLIR